MNRSITFPGVVLLVASLFAVCPICRGNYVVNLAGYVLDSVTGSPVTKNVCLETDHCNCCGIGPSGDFDSSFSCVGPSCAPFPFSTELFVRAQNYAWQRAVIEITSSGTYWHNFVLEPVDGTPVVEAGPPITTNTSILPWSVRLRGSAEDPDLWPDESAKPQWSVVSKPFSSSWVDFDKPHDPETLATFSDYGTYELKLEYNDGARVISDTVTVRLTLFAVVGPTAPSVPDLDPASDTGVSNADNITGDNTPTFDGTAENGVTVTIYSDGSPAGSGITVGGDYRITTSPLADGVHSITAKATDAYGNESAQSGALAVTIDTTLTGNHAPVAEAGGPYTGHVGQYLTLDGSGSHDDDGDAITMYEWDLDYDGVCDDATGVIVQHTWNAPFSGSIALIVWDTHGGADRDTATVTISDTPTGNQCPVVDAGPASMTVNQPLALQGSASDPDHGPGALTIEWSKVSGLGAVSFQNRYDLATTATFSVVGTYVLHLWCSDGDCESTDTVSVEVTAGTTGGGCEPLAYWDFEEGSGTVAHDLSGNGHEGTLIGGSRGGPLWVAGYDGGALRFDGRDDYVDTGITQNLAKWTICCWVSSPAAPANALPSGPMHREQNFQMNWNHTDPKLRSAAVLNVGGTWYGASFGTLAANTWYHLAATYDGTSLKAYRNGQLITTTSCPGTPAAEGSSLKLARHAAAAQFFAGTIDDVYVYPCALSQDEIKSLMTKGVMSILEVVDNGTIADQQACYASLDSTKGTRIEYTAPVLNLYDSGSRGHFGSDEPFGVVKQGRKTAGDVDDLSLRAEGVIRISAAQAGNWTFGVNSDDGFTLLFPGRDFTSVTNGELYSMPHGKAIRFLGGRGAGDTLGVINLPAGDYPFWLTYHEAVGGAEVEFFAAQGARTAFDPELFRLVGQKDIGKVGVPGFCDQVTMLATKPGANGLIDSLAKARAALAASERTIRAVKCLFVNHVDPDTLNQGVGTFDGDVPFPNDVLGKDDNDFAVRVTGLLDIPADGVYQIGFDSDDGASLQITGKTWQSIVADGTGEAVIAGDELINDVVSGNTFTAGQISLTKGCHAFEAVMFEHDGGSYFELFGRGVSDRGIPDPTWHLLRAGGAAASVDVRGLQLVSPQ
jgi:hypothetical protein